MQDITKEKLYLLLPIALLLAIVVIVYLYFVHNSNPTPSAGPNTLLPEISAPNLLSPNQPFSSDALLRQKNVDLIVFWNSSCEGCLNQHKLLMYIASTHLVHIYGVDMHDTQEKAENYIKQYGDPYKGIALDKNGRLGLLLNLQAFPESFLIDKNGMIQDKISGMITPAIWFNRLEPEIESLDKTNRFH